jgi:mRNA interferase YafQ
MRSSPRFELSPAGIPDWLRQHGDHQLVGSLGNYRELHVQADWLLLYTFDGDALTIVRTGSHDDLL